MQSVFRVVVKPDPNVDGMRGIDKSEFHPRKSHKKSRTGCKNCKRRRIKCDETREGGCLKCQQHGMDCDYHSESRRGSHSQLLPKSTSIRHVLDAAQGSRPSPSTSPETICGSESELIPSPRPALSTLSTLSALAGWTGAPARMTPFVHTMGHFSLATFHTMGSDMAQKIIQSSLYSLALETPHLMHAIHGVAAAHLCYLMPAADHPKQYYQNQLADAYHWQRAFKLLRDELSVGANAKNMDALLTTVMLIAVHQFMTVDPAPDPSKSFVYAPAKEREQRLNWLSIQIGVLVVLEQLGTLVQSSVWQPVLDDADVRLITPPLNEFDDPDETHQTFVELCELTSESNEANNPYYSALDYLLALRLLKPTANTFSKLVTFVGKLDERFRKLLLARDKRALLILAHWLALMTGVRQWWITGRSKTECVAIVTFLMHDKDERVRRLLTFPATTAGIVLR